MRVQFGKFPYHFNTRCNLKCIQIDNNPRTVMKEWLSFLSLCFHPNTISLTSLVIISTTLKGDWWIKQLHDSKSRLILISCYRGKGILSLSLLLSLSLSPSTLFPLLLRLTLTPPLSQLLPRLPHPTPTPLSLSLSLSLPLSLLFLTLLLSLSLSLFYLPQLRPTLVSLPPPPSVSLFLSLSLSLSLFLSSYPTFYQIKLSNILKWRSYGWTLL